MRQGHLVVEHADRQLVAAGVPNYKGLYRTPKWSQQAFEAGFEDPLVFGSYTDSFGLIGEFQDAQEVLARFVRWDPRTDLEIIWVTPPQSTTVLPGRTYLGIDIASKAPFWSPLADREQDDWAELPGRLNGNGLFEELSEAERYLSKYRASHPETAPVDLYLWAVYKC